MTAPEIDFRAAREYAVAGANGRRNAWVFSLARAHLAALELLREASDMLELGDDGSMGWKGRRDALLSRIREAVGE